jgi:hypothetical protein
MRHLQLTEERENKLVQYFDKRLKELDSDNRDRINADKKSDKDYENSKKERAKPGTVYGESNLSVPIISYVVDHFAGKTEDEIFGRKPMAGFSPEGPADEDTARGLDRWASYKLFKLGKVDVDLMDCSHTLFRHRALFLKGIYFEDSDMWEEHDVSVLHSGKDNQPVLILNHGYVIEGRDKFIDAIDPVTNQPVQVLEKDPTVALDPNDPSKYFFHPLKKPIRFKDVNYSGPQSCEVDSDCIRIPNNARSLAEADCIVEYYDKSISWVRGRFLDRGFRKWDDYKNQISNKTPDRKTNDERKKAGKESLLFDLENSSVAIAEIWIERDVLEWGQPQRAVYWFDYKNKVLIDYEFQKKVTPSGRHPYDAIAIGKTKRYWWGLSIPEMLDQFQEYVDKQFNRQSFRNGINSNPIVAQNPNAIEETVSFNELKPYDVVTLKDNKTIQDWLQAFVFPNAETNTDELIDKVIYWINFWLGISNIAQGDYSDVPQNTTLGGQEASLQAASKLSRRWSRRVTNGFESHLTKLVQIALATMNPQEVYVYLEGDKEQAAFITEDSVRDFLVNAKLIVAKENSTQKLQEQQMTLQTIQQYMILPPQQQLVVRPVMKKILFLLGHDDVDALLPLPMVPQVDPMTGQVVMVPATAQNLPPAPTAAPEAETQVPTDASTPAAAPAQAAGDVIPFAAPANGY